MVGFPPFHSINKKNLYKRITSGLLNFPPSMDAESKDLLAWLLSTDPLDRPADFSDIKQHPYFFDIHWGRIAKKEAIPPWIPDLYTFHAPKLASLNQVFFKNPGHKEKNRTCHNPHLKSGEMVKKDVPIRDQKSGRREIKHADKIEDDVEDYHYLEGKLQILNFKLFSEFGTNVKLRIVLFLSKPSLTSKLVF